MNFKLCFLLIVCNTGVFGQHDVFVRSIEKKINATTEVLTPVTDSSYLYQQYSYFKTTYWLVKEDNIVLTSNDQWIGGSVMIDGLNDFERMDVCDSTLNLIRNAALSHQTRQILYDTAQVNIGSKNDAFLTFMNKELSMGDNLADFCIEEYQFVNEERLKKGLAFINNIKRQKLARLNQVVNSNTVDEALIAEVLRNMHSCEIDYRTFVCLIEKNTDGFINQINALSADAFFDLKLKLYQFPSDIDTLKACQLLKKSPIQGKRVKVLIRKIK